MFALRDFLGFDKNVIVQASCHSKDNRAMVDALESSAGRAKGVAFVGEEVTDDELKWMDEAGVRGVRFNFLKRLVDFTPRDVLERIAARVDKLGWHVVVYFEMHDLPELEDFFTALPTTVVVDHMGTPDIRKGVDHPENQRFHRLMDRHKNFWVKATCPERMTVAGPPYDDVVPFGRALVERFPDRVIWGTDWPHPNMKKRRPTTGCWSTTSPRLRPRPNCSGSFWSTIPCGSIGADLSALRPGVMARPCSAHPDQLALCCPPHRHARNKCGHDGRMRAEVRTVRTCRIAYVAKLCCVIYVKP